MSAVVERRIGSVKIIMEEKDGFLFAVFNTRACHFIYNLSAVVTGLMSEGWELVSHTKIGESIDGNNGSYIYQMSLIFVKRNK